MDDSGLIVAIWVNDPSNFPFWVDDPVWVGDLEDDVVVFLVIGSGFGDAMQKGFVLDWMRAQDCAVCEESNGYCRFDQATKQSRCLCSEGRTEAKSCKKGTR